MTSLTTTAEPSGRRRLLRARWRSPKLGQSAPRPREPETLTCKSRTTIDASHSKKQSAD